MHRNTSVPKPGVFGSGMDFALYGDGTCWKGSLMLLKWVGLDLVEHPSPLCQGVTFLFRGLGCQDMFLLISPV